MKLSSPFWLFLLGQSQLNPPVGLPGVRERRREERSPYLQHQRSGLSNAMFVCVTLQLLYITKFFCWERGYFQTMDMAHDRAGFYICWGCLVWLPAVCSGTAGKGTISRAPKELVEELRFALLDNPEIFADTIYDDRARAERDCRKSRSRNSTRAYCRPSLQNQTTRQFHPMIRT